MSSTIRTHFAATSCVCTFLILFLFSLQSSGFNNSSENAGAITENDASSSAMEAICPPPIINTQPQSVTACLGSAVTFSVVANTNGPGTIVYQWKKGATNISGATGGSLTISSVTIASAGSYTVSITKSCGATVTSVAAILTVNNVDGGSINGAQTICVGATAAEITNASNGSGSGTLSYQWEESSDLSSWSPIGGATAVTYSPGALLSTKHFRRAIASLLNGITCDAYSNVVSITVTQVTASVSSNSPVCEGSLLTLQATGGVSYVWSGPDGFSSTQQNPSISNVPLSASGTYNVTVTNSSGCSATVTEAVTINPKPIPTASNNSPLCEGASLSLSSCGGTSFLWSGPESFSSTDKISSISEVSMAAAGDYNVTVTNSYGCSGVAVTTVVINPAPAVAANNNGPLCEGGEATLTASGGDSYSWTGPNGFSSTDQNPVVSIASLISGGTYAVTVTNSYGCSATVPTTVVINPAPSVSISSLSVVNVGGLISLNSDGGITYQWSGPNGFTSTEQNPNISGATLANGGTYTVVVTSVDGCSAIASVAITVAAAAPAAASNNGPADEGGTITLSAGEGEEFLWEGPNSFTSTEQTIVIENASSENSGTYTVTVTDALGETYVSSTEVVIYPAPSAATNNPVCEASIINLSADGGVSYSWAGPDGFSSTEQNPIITTASLDNAGTYTVTVTRSNGSTKTATVDLAIDPIYSTTAAPVVSCDDYTLAWNQTVTQSGDYSHSYTSSKGCDSVVTVNVTINSSYNLEGAAVTACDSHTLPWGTNVTASGDYSHTYTSLSGCDSMVSIHVAINPTYHISEPVVNACDSYTLPWGEAVTETGDYSHTYSSITTCDSTIIVHVNVHSSYNTTGDAVSACDSYTLPWGQVVTSEGNYSHTYSSLNGCDSTVTIYVNVHNSYNVVGIPVKDCDSHTMPWGTVVTTSGNYSHTYTTAGGCDSTVAIHVTVNHRYNLVGNAVVACTSYTLPWGEVASTTDDYDYTYTAIGGCDSTVTIHVTINGYPTANASGGSACSGGTINLASSGGTSYSWAGPNGFASSLQNPSISNVTTAAGGTYTVTVSNGSGCSATATASITVDVPSATASSTPACVGQTVTLSASAGNSYAWTGPNGFTSTLQNPTIANVTTAANGTYNVTVTNASGCVASASTSVSVSAAPTATASSNSPVVGGNTTSLTAAGGNSYSWVGPNDFTSSLQNPSILYSAAAMEGTYTVTVSNSNGCTATATTIVDVTCSGFRSYTITQGGWGANPGGNNPAVYRDAHFPTSFPNGLTVGCGSYWLNLTTSLAVQNFLPSGGTANALSQSYTNPGSSLSNTLAGQVVALALNVGFDNDDPNFSSATSMHLQDLYVKSGTFMGWTVLQVLNEAQKKLGGCSSSYTASQLNSACTSINENYDGGKTDKGFLSCMPVRVEHQPTSISESSLKIYPNPSSGHFILDLDLNDDNSVQVDIQILNVLGQSVYRDRTTAVDGKLHQEVKFENNLTGGNYLVRVTSGDRMFTQPIIYQK